jgi:hypothetical protein
MATEIRSRDPEIRAALRRRLELAHASDPRSVVIDEFGVFHGHRRADLVAVNGALDGYEIKSDADTLERLSSQATMFSKVFDTMTLVCAPRHRTAARRRIPRWWGLIVATREREEITLDVVRPAQRNPAVDAELVARLLWRDEAISVLRAFHGDGRADVLRRRELVPLLVELPIDLLRDHLRESIKSRVDWRADRRSG